MSDSEIRGVHVTRQVRIGDDQVARKFHCDRIADHPTYAGDEWPEGRVWVDTVSTDADGFGSICPDCHGMGHLLVEDCKRESGGEL